MQVKWLAKALANLTDEADCIAADSPANAKAFFIHMLASVDQLKEHPHLGRAGRVTGTRELVNKTGTFGNRGRSRRKFAHAATIPDRQQRME